jgi:hypothetical protein
MHNKFSHSSSCHCCFILFGWQKIEIPILFKLYHLYMQKFIGSAHQKILTQQQFLLLLFHIFVWWTVKDKTSMYMHQSVRIHQWDIPLLLYQPPFLLFFTWHATIYKKWTIYIFSHSSEAVHIIIAVPFFLVKALGLIFEYQWRHIFLNRHALSIKRGR